MSGYTDVFGGSTIQPSDVAFAAITLSANTPTYWPAYATTGQVLSRIIKVTASAPSLEITLPDATLAGTGQDVLFDNAGAETFTVLDNAGGVVATIASGEVKYLYLSDTSTAAGVWRVTVFGVGSSALDAAAFAGYGLKAIGATLNTAAVATEISGDTTVASSDRSKIFVWTGGSGTLTLPTTVGSTSDFAIEVRNQGAGTVTLAPVGGVLIDDSASITLSVQESCFVHMGATDWYTVGRGRNTAFNFTQLIKATTGGTTVLTLTEASNVVQKYTGALVSNATITVPAVVQVYYVSNETTGAYTLTFNCAGGGTSVAVTQAQAAILFCDGVNVINANTSLDSGISTIIFGTGTVANPSVAIATASTGFYSSGTNEIGITCNGVYVGKWAGAGLVVAGAASAGSLTLTTDLAVADGGTGRSTGTTAYSLIATGTTATGAQQTLANGATSEVLVGGGAAALPVWTTATGTGAPVRANSPTLVTPALGTPSSGVVTNLTGTASININGTVGATTPNTGSFTTLAASGNATLGDAEATDTHAVKGATTVLANSTSAALTVTQTGAGDAFVVEDSASTDSTPFVIDASGSTIAGHTASINTVNPNGVAMAPHVQVHGSTNWGAAATNIASWAVSESASFVFDRSKSATIGTHSVVASGDKLGTVQFTGSDGTGFIRAAQITSEVDGTPGTNDMPGRLVFSTTADGAASPTERMRIDSSGNVGFGGSPAAGESFRMVKAVTGAATATSMVQFPTINSDVTTAAYIYRSGPYTQSASFTLGNLVQFQAINVTLQGASAVTVQHGFNVSAGFISAGTNYSFFAGDNAAITSGKVAFAYYSTANIASGGGDAWGLYMAGTAPNRFVGETLVIGPAGLGYGAGAGGTVTQATSKTTAVTLNKPTGQITMNNAALAAGVVVAFDLNNSLVAATDNVLVTFNAGVPSVNSNYTLSVSVGSGKVFFVIKNITGGSLSEALVINFAVIKGATS